MTILGAKTQNSLMTPEKVSVSRSSTEWELVTFAELETDLYCPSISFIISPILLVDPCSCFEDSIASGRVAPGALLGRWGANYFSVDDPLTKIPVSLWAFEGRLRRPMDGRRFEDVHRLELRFHLILTEEAWLIIFKFFFCDVCL
ncbi:uncharacterized protein BT62DRAFT_1074476 [Guyanagaster necrorhizus]|uniref:Uncharacterized protein n=1 Tax=Guyanagaster necrorhizus TaxID=856835 RepID=A0A9P7VWP9_9AGAR|nr:uncharacterized protein BT62DRAFT_1074476 [Guyanagaster necrorhizus MCA 3950]KAG7447942.1 hypothetical protein BT62DRAFT_1074476 [Guyanagaster necrorhizus MCA 3950]